VPEAVEDDPPVPESVATQGDELEALCDRHLQDSGQLARTSLYSHRGSERAYVYEIAIALVRQIDGGGTSTER